MMSLRRRVHLDRRHQRLIEPQVDRVELALPRREACRWPETRASRPTGSTCSRARSRTARGRRPSASPCSCGSASRRCSARSRSARSTTARSAPHFLNTNSASACSSYSFMPGLRVAHRLHDAEPGDPRRLADDGDLARALDRAQRVEDRIEVRDLGLRRGRLQLLDELLLARDAAVPGVRFRRAPQRAPDPTTTPRRGPRAGTACRSCAARARSPPPPPRTPRAAAPRRCPSPSRPPARETAPVRTSAARGARFAAADRASSSSCARRSTTIARGSTTPVR